MKFSPCNLPSSSPCSGLAFSSELFDKYKMFRPGISSKILALYQWT